MKPNLLFNHIWDIDYNKSGFDLDWKVEVDDIERQVRLLFCPSNSNKDWFINIAGFIPIIKFPFIYCWGWVSVFDGCKAQIMEEFIRSINEHKDYNVLICGHSYGGTESIIAGIELYKLTKIKPDIITFGAPMQLYFYISKFLAKRCFRSIVQYAHKSDIVTYSPPIIGLHHVKVKRLGKFSFKNLFNPYKYHMIYGEEDLY